MEEIQPNYTQGSTDPDATLVQPRFDMLEEQTAQPVVPLTRAAAWRQRRLPVALVLISALVGGLVSVVAYRLYQRAAEPRPVAEVTSEARPAQSPELTASAPTTEAARSTDQTAKAEAPAQTTDARAQATDAHAQTSDAPHAAGQVEQVRNDAPTGPVEAPPQPARAEGRGDEGAARGERTRATAADRPRGDAAPRARRVEVITSPEAERGRFERRRHDDDGDEYAAPPEGREGRRGRRIKGRNIDRIRDIFGAPPPA